MGLPNNKKSLGQHFLVSANVINSIVESKSENVELILEVGPGPQALTKPLSQLGLPFQVVERDDRFRQDLANLLGTENVHMADALDFDFEKIIMNKSTWMVSNLPYNISAPLFIKFLQLKDLKWLTLMFQKEVALKLLPQDGKSSSLSCLASHFFKVKKVVDAPPGAFSPPPKVNSRVLFFERIESSPINLEDFPSFEKFLRFFYSQRRKKVLPRLKKSHPNGLWQNIFLQLDLNPDSRPEQIREDQVGEIFCLNGRHL